MGILSSAPTPAAVKRAPMQRAGGWLLLAVVVLAHFVLVNDLALDRFGWGADEPRLRRIEVAFVRELEPQAPPAAAPAVKPRRVRRAAVPAAAPAASAPAPVEEAIAQASPPVPADAPESLPAPAAVAGLPASAPADTVPTPVAQASSPPAVASPQPAASAVAVAEQVAPAFDWPPSTRLTYEMEGNYRGSLQGSAQVEWLRSGSRYQVHLETRVLPVMSRRVSSEGELTDHGLAPRRFEGEQKVLLRAPRRWTLQFGADRITLSDGRQVATQPGAQDEASQFVQLTWLFTTQPHLLQVGQSLEIPLVLARKIDRWIYDVKEKQTLHLPFGPVETFYVKPRREAKGGDLTAEIWFAPSLMYLPVRILVRQDESTYVNLVLEKPPLQAAR